MNYFYMRITSQKSSSLYITDLSNIEICQSNSTVKITIYLVYISGLIKLSNLIQTYPGYGIRPHTAFDPASIISYNPRALQGIKNLRPKNLHNKHFLLEAKYGYSPPLPFQVALTFFWAGHHSSQPWLLVHISDDINTIMNF